MQVRARGCMALLLGLTTASNALPVFMEDGFYMGTQFSGYSLRGPKVAEQATDLNQTYYGAMGSWQFGVTPVFGLLSNIFGGEKPYLDMGGFQITDNFSASALVGTGYPVHILLGFVGDYGLSYRFGHGKFSPSISTTVRAAASNGPSEYMPLLGLEVNSYMLHLGPNLVEVHVPASREKDERSWLYFNYHKITDDDDGERNLGMLFRAGMTWEWYL